MRQLDKKQSSTYRKSVDASVLRTVELGRPLRFVVFTCSTITSQYLFSATAERYVSLSTRGNNLEPDIAQLGMVVKQLRKIYPTTLTVIIGNTDPYYIYLQQFKNVAAGERVNLTKKFAQRWGRYRSALYKYAASASGLSEIEVVSWYEIEKNIEATLQISFEAEFNFVYRNIDKYFSQKNLDWELGRLGSQFGTGKYFAKLAAPSSRLLRDWVRRKFAEYSVQGRWLYDYFPNAILIQNEKPSDLRSLMYQPLVGEQHRSKLPIVYFLGVDNAGYR